MALNHVIFHPKTDTWTGITMLESILRCIKIHISKKDMPLMPLFHGTGTIILLKISQNNILVQTIDRSCPMTARTHGSLHCLQSLGKSDLSGRNACRLVWY